MRQNYHYKLYKQDGEVVDLGVRDSMPVKEMYQVLDCTMVEVIPRPYYPETDKADSNVTYWGDEEGRYKDGNQRNPFMEVLQGDTKLGEPAEWDCVGNLLREEIVRG